MFTKKEREKHSLRLNCLVQCFTACLLISYSVLIVFSQDVHGNSLALENHLKLRLKRQSSTPDTNSNSAPNPKQQVSSSASSSDSSTNGQGTDEEKSQEPALSSLKCDFGSSEAPDLCKFHILETGNALSKGFATWLHGSGKLALFQGGPLIDASGGNDTSGGYIFYETSNPYIGNFSPSSTNNQSTTSFAHSHQLYDGARQNHPQHQHQEPPAEDYLSVSSSRSARLQAQSSIHAMQTHDPGFQYYSSARVAIGGMGGGSFYAPGPSFMSPNLTAPGPSGMCLSFQYLIQGLSAEELRIYVNDHKTERSRLVWASSESAASNWTRGEVLYSVTNMHSLMFSAAPGSSSAKDVQQRKFRGHIALDEIDINKHDPNANQEGACKGHCNFDGDLCGWTNAENKEEDDFDWSLGRGSDNLFTGPTRDFTSSNNNELTGSYLHINSGYPRRPGDRAMLVSPMFQPTPMNDAMCMRFAAHMFGSGIGSLVIKIRYADEAASAAPVPGTAGVAPAPISPPASTRADGKPSNDLVIWEMSGDAGNNWHQAQTSVSSSKSQFQVVIEGVIGENHLGNIAIDEISFSSGPCPTSPPIASKNYGDCTFEQSMCYWRNPDADMRLDDLDWVRSADEQSIHGPNFDHTLKKRSGSYLKLENTFREPKSGTRAFLLSPIFQPKAQGGVQCLSFYYYMFMRSISSSGPNLGTIRVYLASNNELVPIWRLTNPVSSPNWKHGRASLSTALIDGQPTAPTKLFQIAFEGIWGDAPGGAIALDDITVFDGACEIMPPEAKSVPGECTFDVDMCSWSNKTSEMITSMGDSIDGQRSPFIQSVNSVSGHTSSKLLLSSKRMSWQLATVDSRPVNLQDHTYRAPIGYVYIDVLDGGSSSMSYALQSAEVTVQSGVQVAQCLSFWYAAYGRQENNLLNIYLTQASVPPPQPEDSSTGANAPSAGSFARSNQPNSSSSSTSSNSNQATSSTTSLSSAAASGSGSSSSSESDSENPNAWKSYDGKLLWSMSLRNITENNRRKWQYGQVALKADSNFIIRFVANSIDGGFALDDISYYDGLCETRPSQAKIQSDDDTTSDTALANPKSTT